jgi:hypothetical protein
LAEAHERGGYFRSCVTGEAIEPVRVGAAAGRVEIFANLDQGLMVTHMAPYRRRNQPEGAAETVKASRVDGAHYGACRTYGAGWEVELRVVAALRAGAFRVAVE